MPVIFIQGSRQFDQLKICFGQFGHDRLCLRQAKQGQHAVGFYLQQALQTPPRLAGGKLMVDDEHSAKSIGMNQEITIGCPVAARDFAADQPIAIKELGQVFRGEVQFGVGFIQHGHMDAD